VSVRAWSDSVFGKIILYKAGFAVLVTPPKEVPTINCGRTGSMARNNAIGTQADSGSSAGIDPSRE